MARWAPAKRDVLDAVAQDILHNYGRGRVLVGVDGIAGAGQARFADELGDAVRATGHHVFRASLEGFHRPRAELARIEGDAARLYRDSYDYSVFRRILIDPFRLGVGAGFVTAAWDAERDVAIEPRWRTGPHDAVLIVDGAWLLRNELAGLWNYTLWLDTGVEPDEASTLYLADARPRAAATAIMDVSDPDVPRRVFADSC